MFSWEPVAPDATWPEQVGPDGPAVAAHLQRLGWKALAGFIRRLDQGPDVFEDALADAAMESGVFDDLDQLGGGDDVAGDPLPFPVQAVPGLDALREQQDEEDGLPLLPDSVQMEPGTPSFWLVAPDSPVAISVGEENGLTNVECITMLDNGAMVFTILDNALMRELREAGHLTSWPEGGSYWRTHPEGDVAGLLPAHEAFVAQVADQEGATPFVPSDVDDLVLIKRNTARLSDNRGFFEGTAHLLSPAQAVVAPDEDADWVARGMASAATSALDAQHEDRWERIQGLATARHDLDALRKMAVREPTHPDWIGRWESWTDEEMARAAQMAFQPPDPHRQRVQVEAMFDALAAERPPLDDDPSLRTAWIDAQVGMLQGLYAGEEEEDLAPFVEQLADVMQRLGWVDEPDDA